MKIGTIEATEEKKRKSKHAKTMLPSGGGGKRSRGGGGGGGSDGGSNDFSELHQRPDEKARIVTWFLLLIVFMTFSAMFGAYIVIAANSEVEWRPFSLPYQLWISTALIAASSFAFEMGRKNLILEEIKKQRLYFRMAMTLGLVFIVSQIIVWIELMDRGLYMSGNPYAGFFYILTIAHALHVLGGVIAMAVLIHRTWFLTDDLRERRYRIGITRSIGWYWHFIGILWLVLFALLGFWH
jgi:cytochrome c oxidase subunit 3